MSTEPIQDLYPDSFSYCYGCGRLNEHGLKIKSIHEGGEVVCTLTPQPYHLAVPGFVYGGLIASIIDCHSIGTASAVEYYGEGRAGGSEPPIRFVTKSLHVDYYRATPIEEDIVVRARLIEMRGKERVIESELYSGGVLRAQGEVIAVPIPDHMLKGN
ncbi:MAG TPA: PaaI family thioesterase [Anaerolineales bacterium]|nr:PaaI family thioesterase [Anaerolineales bacterium]